MRSWPPNGSGIISNIIHVDRTKYVVSGGSAGGHLALMVGMATAAAQAGPVILTDFRIAAIVNGYGPTDVADLIKRGISFAIKWLPANTPNRDAIAVRMSPMTYVRKDIPPLLTVQGDGDPTVPVDQNQRLLAALKAGQVPRPASIWSGAGHGFTDSTWPDAERVYSTSSPATEWEVGGVLLLRGVRTDAAVPAANPNAAEAMLVAALPGACAQQHNTPVAYFMTHGTADQICAYPRYGVPLLQDFAKVNGCAMPDPNLDAMAFDATLPKPTSVNSACIDFMGCKPGYPTRSCLFVGPHEWNPGNPTWVPAEVWSFFKQLLPSPLRVCSWSTCWTARAATPECVSSLPLRIQMPSGASCATWAKAPSRTAPLWDRPALFRLSSSNETVAVRCHCSPSSGSRRSYHWR